MEFIGTPTKEVGFGRFKVDLLQDSGRAASETWLPQNGAVSGDGPGNWGIRGVNCPKGLYRDYFKAKVYRGDEGLAWRVGGLNN